MRLAVLCAFLVGLVLAPVVCDLYLYFVHGSIASRGIGELEENVIVGGAPGWLVAAEILVAFVWAVWAAFEWGSHADSGDRSAGER